MTPCVFLYLEIMAFSCFSNNYVLVIFFFMFYIMLFIIKMIENALGSNKLN